MKLTTNILCIALFLLAGPGKAQEVINISSNAFGQNIDPYHIPASREEQKGRLERTRMTIGTIYRRLGL